MACAGSGLDVEILERATSQLGRRHRAPRNGTDSGSVGQADEGEEESNADSASRLDGGWDQLAEPLSHSRESKEYEDEPFDEHGSQCETVRDRAGSVKADDLVGEVGVETHSGTIRTLVSPPVCTISGSHGTHARATGRLVKKPKRQLARPDRAAVAVIRSRLSPEKVSP